MKMTQIKVRNMTSSRGNKVANQFVIDVKNGEYLQSYNSIIAFKPIGVYYKGSKSQILLDEKYWEFSVTTGKYRNSFLGEGIAETRKKIASGEYKLVDLN